MKQTARGTALDALLQMEENEGYSNIIIDKALKAAELDKRDGALASTIFYGVLEKQLTLDYFIAQCLSEPDKKMDKAVRMALRCGAYQICYLDRIPDSAAVNETVNAVKARGKAKLSGFVNGVLRNLIRKKESLATPEGDTPYALSLRYSVPKELIMMWRAAYGIEITKKLLESFEQRAETFVRINNLKTDKLKLSASFSEKEIGLELLDFPRNSAKIENCGSPAALPEFLDGLFHVQDLSAQLVCEILSPQPGDDVCDCCAAPGGKTFTLAEMMNGEGTVTAFDLYKGRVKLIADGAARLGITNITAKAADASKPLLNLPQMDRVLCDVPCSGFGVIRRKPEIRYKNPEDTKALPELQYAILQNSSKLVKPGGVLVYSTCTLNPKENGEVAERFLKENNGFKPMKIDLPNINHTIDEPSNHLTMFPFAGASDGFFSAAFVRE